MSVGQAYSAENRERNRKLYERLEKCYSETLKIIFAGDFGVGKSNILSRFDCNYFCKDKYGHHYMEYACRWIQHGDKRIKVGFWGTGGRERFNSVGQRGIDGAFLVYDISNHVSFEHAEKWLQEVRQFADHTDFEPVVLLVGNKTDLETAREVSTEEAERFAERNNLLHVEVSALASNNIKEAFQLLVEEVLWRRFQRAKHDEIQFRDTIELWAKVNSETNISIPEDIFRLFVHPDFLIVFIFLVCVALYVFCTK